MAKSKSLKSKSVARDTKIGYLFLTPWLIGVVLFAVIPFIMTFAISFMAYSKDIFGINLTWIGFENYINAFIESDNFKLGLFDFITVELLYVPIVLITSFIIALILNKKIKGRAIFRTIFFLPVIILSGTLMSTVFGADASSAANLESSFIYKIISEYSTDVASAVAYIYKNFVMILWFTGIPIILFINGLQKINKNLYEAASIDGANSWQTLWKVVIPIVRPLAGIIGVFTIVQIAMLPTSGLYQEIVDSMKTANNYGYTNAISVVYVLTILIFIAISALILIPREKKAKEVITRTQNIQKRITLAKMEEEENNGKDKSN